MTNSINWFEIPVNDFSRAKKFYETLYGAEIMEMPHPMYKYGMLPADMQNGGVGGGIVQGEGFEPSTKGTIVYLNGGEDLSVALSKVENAGGKIIMPKTAIGANGFMAQFIDTEGNRIALHSMK
ncbi:VOC family protein [Lacihabitans sp. CCS-44]|uniref:VOC family protein n=1 Tax=Lacihabitans sp. CCS-44 TaxID=2487331 RepID=UPI0020CDE45E|nr:VOC family protein [Lacihabitans sp. CCS-44]MCP9754794.1 VOC family protein [Lacihabitans sp. CCS-44]